MSTLCLVPTPIGNLSDISPRARQALADADFIAAEDTRVALRLLNHLGLKKPLVSYYEHNKEGSGPKIVARILTGQRCALVSDAGSPAISDPGEDLVRLCAEAGIPVTAIPGPCAAITALSISGLPTGRFCFEGFLSTNKKSRQAHLDGLRSETRTMIFYEAPHKLTATLADLSAVFGAERRISLCRELTKLHEEVLRTTLGEAAAYYAEHAPRGEFVLIVEGAAPLAPEAVSEADALEAVRALIGQGLSRKDAVRRVSEQTGIPKNELYNAAVRE
ncbi:MAG: 16S rRNA (cytidine(1402)-2'-O)-methyltransferase [Candidatus Faecousia sp.]|uniref:16S rRNA (cytidine(1402)-2'-O)-methyltransferase n=1 Tax=Faecousia sp. TaxID=2952921 RepID=UPI002A8886AF|nr:16S rRNA (cytidine(1402)-2'-O)-methyltransferase [Candidatus Faecousia sp.]